MSVARARTACVRCDCGLLASACASGVDFCSTLHGVPGSALCLLGLELTELAANQPAHRELRIRMCLVLGLLAARDQTGGLVESILERGRAGQRVLEEGFAEPGELAVFLTAEGAVGGVRGGHDRRGLALQLIDEHPRVARRNHHYPPADSRGIERRAQIAGRELCER